MANTIMSAKNGFSEGLILDMSPENTSANCLTSALNATLVTYNGNEMTLQNDMGNGRVETAFLPEGYVPVGTCEFGDIIYIVSYNPLINKSLIGCFPSPERNISSDEIGGMDLSLSFNDFLNSDWTLKTTSVKKILYGNKYMNSGDKYIIYSSDLKDDENNKYLSDYKNPTHEHGKLPRLVKIHVVSIEESGKIVYLDSTTKWYNSNDYYLNADLSVDNEGIKDLDSYRTMVSSAYSVFSSKVSGKLALLIELEKITGFSCSWTPYVTSSSELKGDDIKETEYSIYWNFSWTTDDNRINPHGVMLRDHGWRGLNKGGVYAGTYRKWAYNTKNSKYELSSPISVDDNVSSYSVDLTRTYKPENATFNNIDGYEETVNNYNWAYKVNIDRRNGIPNIDTNSNNYYYVNCVRVDKNGKFYDSNNPNNPNNDPISPVKINDDIVNNYFHYPIIKPFHKFSIPTKLVIPSDNGEIIRDLDISNLIYYYKVAPTMPYGILDEFAQEGYIDFSKIGSKHISLHTWKYYNYENTSTLTWGMEAYTEPNKGISEVVFEFYDNNGFVAAYHNKGKLSYNGTFTEYLTLNESGSNYKLNNIEAFDTKPTRHPGVEVTKNTAIPGVYYKKKGDLNSSWSTYSKDEIERWEDDAIYYQDDSGTLYSNCLYLVKIIIKYCNKGILDEYLEPTSELAGIDEGSVIIDYRWYWTNNMFNEYYYLVLDFKELLFTLNLDCNAVYSQINLGSLSETVLYLGIANTETTEIGKNEYTLLSANVTYINLKDPKNNIQCLIKSGLINDYNTFNLYGGIRDNNIVGELSNFEVTTYLGKAYLESIALPEIVSAEDIGYIFSGIYPTNDDILEGTAEINSNHGDILHELIGLEPENNSNEINSSETSYTNYKNTFSLTYKTENGTETIDYISITGDVVSAKCPFVKNDLENIEYNINKDYIDFIFLGLLFSKFYEPKSEKTTTATVVKPLLYDDEDMNRYNMSFDNNFYFKNFGGFILGSDDDGGTLCRLRYCKKAVNLKDGKLLASSGGFVTHIGGPNGGKIFDSYFTSDMQSTDEGSLVEVFPGITPFVLMRDDSGDPYGYDYKIVKGINNHKGTRLSATSEYKKYFGTFYNYVDNGIGNGMYYDLGRITERNKFAFLAMRDSEEHLHFINTFIPIDCLNSNYISLNIRYNNSTPLPYSPKTIGDAIASLFMSLYYTTGNTEEIKYFGPYNFVYLKPHTYTYTKDIIHKLVVKDSVTSQNDLILILGMPYNTYLSAITNLFSNYKEYALDNNVNVVINPVFKNCPIQFLFEYITPIQQTALSPKLVVKCADGTDIFSNQLFASGALYQLDLKDFSLFNRIGSKVNILYYPYKNITYSDNSRYIGEKRTDVVIQNPDLASNFKLSGEELVCTNTNENFTNSYTIWGAQRDNAWANLGPLHLGEVLLSMGKLS